MTKAAYDGFVAGLKQAGVDVSAFNAGHQLADSTVANPKWYQRSVLDEFRMKRRKDRVALLSEQLAQAKDDSSARGLLDAARKEKPKHWKKTLKTNNRA